MGMFDYQARQLFDKSFIPGETKFASTYPDVYVTGLKVGTRIIQAAGLNSIEEIPETERGYFILDIAREYGIDINAHGSIGVDGMHAFELGRAAGMDHPLKVLEGDQDE